MDELNELDNLDFFDEDYQTVSETELENQTKDTDLDEDVSQEEDQILEEDHEDDLLSEYLKSKGIDPTSVKVQNDEGNTEEINFNDLSREEQLLILNYNPVNLEAPELAEDEEKLLSILRQNNMTVLDYLNSYKNHVIQEYVASQPTTELETYDVDDYTDEELFIADLKDKVPDLTEDEAVKELEMQQQNPELFKKKVAGLRASYLEREKLAREYEAQQEQEKQAQQAAQFEQVIVDTIQNNNSIDLGDTSLELSEDDMNEIASFILDSDSAGVRHIAKALNDPKMLVEMAWWALKGHDALNQVTQYYKKQISEARRSNTTPLKLKPRTVVTKKPRQNDSRNDSDLFDNLI